MLKEWREKILKQRMGDILPSGTYLPITPRKTVFNKCNQCTRCCTDGGIQLYLEDIRRIQKQMQTRARTYIMFLMLDTFGPLYNVSTPSITISLRIRKESKKCVFLSGDGCGLYPKSLKNRFGTDDLSVFQKTKEILKLSIEQDPRPYFCKIYPFYLAPSKGSSVRSAIGALITRTATKVVCYGKNCPSVISDEGNQDASIDWDEYQKFVKVYESFTKKTKERIDQTITNGIEPYYAFYSKNAYSHENTFHIDLPGSGRYEVVDEINNRDLLHKVVSIFERYGIDY